MTTPSSRGAFLRPLLVMLGAAFPASVDAHRPRRHAYTAAKTRDDAVRQDIAATPPSAPCRRATKVIAEARAVISAYEALVRRYRASGYSDNALYNAATLAEALHAQFSLTTDCGCRAAPVQTPQRRIPDCPAGQGRRRSAGSVLAGDSCRATAPVVTCPAAARRAPSADRCLPETAPSHRPPAPRTRTRGRARADRHRAHRAARPGPRDAGARSRSHVPRRNARGSGAGLFRLQERRGCRTARRRRPALSHRRRAPDSRRPPPERTIRVVLDLEGVKRHSVYTLYNPYRIVIDAEPPGHFGRPQSRAESRPCPAHARRRRRERQPDAAGAERRQLGQCTAGGRRACSRAPAAPHLRLAARRCTPSHPRTDSPLAAPAPSPPCPMPRADSRSPVSWARHLAHRD